MNKPFVEKNHTLEKDGFVHLRNVFTAAEVQKLRSSVEKIYRSKPQTSGDNDYIKWDIFNKNADLRFILFNAFIINFLKKTLGDDFVLLNDMSMLKSSFKGWHKDTSNFEFAGHRSHYEKDFLLLNVIIYLQENTSEYGGGLDVLPGSHLSRYDELVTRLPSSGKKNFFYYLKRIRPKLKVLYLDFFEKYFFKKIDLHKKEKYTIPNKIGDVLIFDQRLTHKASWPKDTKLTPDKFLINFSVSANNAHARTFMNFLKQRKDFKHLDNNVFSDDFLEELSKNNIQICS